MAEFPDTRISLILRLNQPEDVQAWQEFADIYAPAIYGLAIRRGLQPADAEDVTQEVLFGAARAIERFEPDERRAKFGTWLGRIARNLLADFCAGRAKRPLSLVVSDSWLRDCCSPNDPANQLDDAFDDEYRKSLLHWAARRVRQRITDVTWNAFEQTAIHNRPAQEVAKALNISLGNLYVYRCRVVKMLRGEVQSFERTYADRGIDMIRVLQREKP